MMNLKSNWSGSNFKRKKRNETKKIPVGIIRITLKLENTRRKFF